MQLQQKEYLPNSAHISLSTLAISGQAFRINRLDENNYVVPTGNSVFICEQRPEGIYYESFAKGPVADIHEYFRTHISLAELVREMKSDPFIAHAYARHGIIPLLKQDLFETMISFIISANKHFKHICQCIEALCDRFGEKIETPYGTFSLFPTPAQLATASLEALRNCKVGYRAEYIQSAAQKIVQDPSFLTALPLLSPDAALSQLKSLKGIGEKVADCVLLFALADDLTVPYDVWLHRIMEDLYEFPANTPYTVYRSFNEKHFGKYAGWVQQTLFYHARKVHRRGVSLKDTWFDIPVLTN